VRNLTTAHNLQIAKIVTFATCGMGRGRGTGVGGMSLDEALEPLVPTVTQALLDSFKNGQTHGRGALAYLVRVLPLLNRHACDLWRKERHVPYLLTICDYLYTTGHRSRYFDGVLFKPGAGREGTAECYPNLEKKPKTLLNLETINVHRRKLAEKLSENPDLFRQPGLLSNLSSLHVPSQFYLCIWQMHNAFRAHPRYDEVFTECQRAGCTRPALLKREPCCEDEEEDNESSEAEYWKCCRDGDSPPPTSSLPSSMAFCCHGCFKAASAEFKQMVKFDIVTPSTPARKAKSRHAHKRRDGGTSTPAQLYRAAVQRNLAIDRQLRNQPQLQMQHYPSSMANHEQLLRERIIMLSVDLGLLYAASIVTHMNPKHPLPNRDNWRDYPKFYIDAVCKVRHIYLAYGKGALARGDESELWMRRLRDRLLEIF